MRVSWQALILAVVALGMAACGGPSGGKDTVPASGYAPNATALEYTKGASLNAMVGRVAVHAQLPKNAAATKGSGGNLIYNGGPIQKNPVIYVIYWGFDGTTATDPDGVAPYLTKFLQGLSGNSYYDIMTQYYSTAAGAIQDPRGEFAGAWYDTSSMPNNPSDSQMAHEAIRAAAHFGYSYDASYVIALPHNSYHNLKWCAYHNRTTSSYGEVHYTNMPYQPDFPACGTDSVNTGAQGLLDSTSETAAHEIAETQTDPDTKTGWYDTSGNEIGDYCAYINLQNITISTGTFATQPLWSNAANYCAISYP